MRKRRGASARSGEQDFCSGDRNRSSDRPPPGGSKGRIADPAARSGQQQQQRYSSYSDDRLARQLHSLNLDGKRLLRCVRRGRLFRT
jgi:hypothetical protein